MRGRKEHAHIKIIKTAATVTINQRRGMKKSLLVAIDNLVDEFRLS
jgi:hypothetical protein